MGAPIPDLPELGDDDSMLSRKFGREIANYFSGSPLNRVSFLRGDHAFLRSAFAHPSAAFLLMDDLSPLVRGRGGAGGDDENRLAFASGADVAPLTGADPFARREEEMVRDFNSEEAHPLILFLGIDDKSRVSGPSSFEYREYKGSPFFAVDVTPREPFAAKANSVIDAVKSRGWSFNKAPRHMGFSANEGKGKVSKAVASRATSLRDR